MSRLWWTVLTARVTVINSPVEHPFAFQKTGWYMFVINQTWVQPTIVRLFSGVFHS